MKIEKAHKLLEECAEYCKKHKVSCPVKDCNYWINYPSDLNCTLICAEEHGPMSLRDIAKRLNISYVTVKNIEERALLRLKKKIPQKEIEESFY